APLSIAPGGALGTESAHHPVADFVDEPSLRNGDDAERGQPAHVFRTTDAAVLDPMTMVGPWMGRQRVLVDVEHGRDGTVAARGRRDLPARTMRARDDPPQPLDVHLEEATIAGLTLEVTAHGRGAADQRPVGEDLHGADAKPVVAPTRANAKVEAKAVAVRDGMRQVVERLGGDHQRGPHSQAPLPARLLPDGQLD